MPGEKTPGEYYDKRYLVEYQGYLVQEAIEYARRNHKKSEKKLLEEIANLNTKEELDAWADKMKIPRFIFE